MPLWERESCDAALRTQFGANYRIPDTALCAGAEGRDACDVSRNPALLSLLPGVRDGPKYEHCDVAPHSVVDSRETEIDARCSRRRNMVSFYNHQTYFFVIIVRTSGISCS